MSVTGEYTAYFGGTVDAALAAINATMARVNPIYERDFAITMVLIDNTDQVIYTNANTDPYSPAFQLNNWNGELEQTLNSVIGFNNYDIGHLFGASGGGGNAGCIGCVCNSGKGSAYTSPADGEPEGDSFDIDYVAHEMGHQFGGNHTFSRSEGSGANLEPGSGTSIMAYAGITGATDVQDNSDDLFHYISIEQITSNVENKNCPAETSISNNPPTVNAGQNYTIPAGTAFKLTATGSDPDGDNLTYSWEQGDVSFANSFTFPSSTSTSGPNFRAKPATSSPTRFFPALDFVLAGELYPTWEMTSEVTRTFNFTVQARDNNVNIGQTASDNMQVSVNASNDPFKIINFGLDESASSGGTFVINWDVAGTNLAPFSSPQVNILLSTDGGETFNVIESNTANDGSEEVNIPEGSTSLNAYLMVESASNVFYAVSTPFIIDYTANTTCQTYTPNAGGLPADIPDGNGNNYGSYATLFFSNIPDIGEISDVNVDVEINHTYIQDLQISVLSPGATVLVWDRECTEEDDMDITFDDLGSPIISTRHNNITSRRNNFVRTITVLATNTITKFIVNSECVTIVII